MAGRNSFCHSHRRPTVFLSAIALVATGRHVPIVKQELYALSGLAPRIACCRLHAGGSAAVVLAKESHG